MDAYAHSANDAGFRHRLADHLRSVAQKAAGFAAPFGAADVARIAGLYHDLGKFHPDFQKYLSWCEANPGQHGSHIDHKAAGATFASKTPAELRAWLSDDNVRRRIDVALTAARSALPELHAAGPIPLPEHIATSWDAEMFVRMLFSCLVDADFLDTEAHFSPGKSAVRDISFDAAAMRDHLHVYRDGLHGGSDDAVSTLRRAVAAACEDAGARPSGIYRMTVPTGGGKTLAGMAFALRHAAEHGKRRVVVAIPFTSITEQTASVYRKIFGAKVVLEHHSAVAWTEKKDDDEPTAQYAWQRLAAENWDAPVVVTTTVQLFESLLGNRVSASRKLHNLADSVLILDEVQMLPTQYIDPILDVLRGLAEHYGTTVLLSTATQPQFAHQAFRDLPEIAPDPRTTFDQLRRVEYEFAASEWSWNDAAARLAGTPQGMMVLNTKRDAIAALQALGDDRALHLSTLLCGAHRRDVLVEVKRRLTAGEPCRLVTTQVVEAGVDLDFPAVFRAMGPLDRLIQAAGRCNREGHLDRGAVTVFKPSAGGLPPGSYRTATQITAKLLRGGTLDLHDPKAAGRYFGELYATAATDADGIQKLRASMNYPEVAHRFRLIKDDTEDVVVPYGSADERATVEAAVEALRSRHGSARELMRRIQPYTVGLRRRDLGRAAARGYVAPVLDGVWAWTGPPELYDGVRGLMADGSDEELLIG